MKVMASARFVRLLVLGLWAVVSCAVAQPSGRIWGGEEASKDDFPFVASVRLDGSHVCGGSIIGSKSILTAAHCLQEKGQTVATDRLSVRVGSINQFSGGSLVYIASINLHPDYSGVKNDIAVLTLENTLVWTDRIRSINLATNSEELPAVGASVTVAGWGEQLDSESAFKLNALSFNVDSAESCINAYSDADDSIICLAHPLKKGSCYGDAGNGATFNNRLVGVNNFVVGACGSRYPDVFASVAHFAPWIQSVLA
ncbi:trypsin delta [Stomoxys calcitrans]|uniref:trypsin delta n=1 Tax=Stomoxys calcitrans TaxID=35570 RepID=UPI0027E24820|nr:trypsin delta [Stomoxys calcitrans]